MPRNNPHKTQRNSNHHNQRRLERLEPPDNQQINNNQHHRKRRPQIPEHLKRNLPLTVPLHRHLILRSWSRSIKRINRIPRRQLDLLDFLIHIEHGIDRTFRRTGNIRSHIHHPAEILVKNALLLDFLLNLHQFRQWNHFTGTQAGCQTSHTLRLHKNTGKVMQRCSVRLWQPYLNRYRIKIISRMNQPHIHARKRQTQRLGYLFRAHSPESSLLFIDHQIVHLLVSFNHPVNIDNTGSLLKHLFHLTGKSNLLTLRRPVNFSNQRRHNRGPRRNLDDLGIPMITQRNLLNTRSYPFGNVVALRLTVAFMHKIHLDISHIRLLTEIVVTHKTIEIDRRIGPDIVLVAADLRYGFQIGGNLLGDSGRLLKRSAFRHIQNNLKLILVVKRQHLHLHSLQRHQRNRTSQHQPHNTKRKPPFKRTFNKRRE